MKKLELVKMESIQGSLAGRDCFLMGVGIFVLGAIASEGGAWGMVAGGGAIGGFFTAAASSCF